MRKLTLLIFVLGITLSGVALPQYGDYTAASKEIAEQLNNGLYYSRMNNYPEAIKWYTMAAEQGDPEAQYQLGKTYLRLEGGTVTEELAAKALPWFEKAAINRDYRAYGYIGFCLVILNRHQEAVTWYERASQPICRHESNYANYCEILARYCFWGEYTELDWEKSKRLYEIAKEADQRGINSIFPLGFLYWVDQDFQNAFYTWREDVDRTKDVSNMTGREIRATKSKHNIGSCYACGYGVQQSYKEAVRYWKEAANEGLAISQYCLGYCYYYGRGVQENKEEALKWFSKAAKQSLDKWEIQTYRWNVLNNSSIQDYLLSEKHYKEAVSLSKGTKKEPSLNVACLFIGVLQEESDKNPDNPPPPGGDIPSLSQKDKKDSLSSEKNKKDPTQSSNDDEPYNCDTTFINVPPPPPPAKKQKPLPPCKYITIIGDQVTVLDSCPELVPPVSSFDTQDMISINMVLVPAGTFQMGCTEGQGTNCVSNERPAHQVTLDTFYISQTEVTQALWEKVMGINPSAFKQGGNYPVEKISWNDCQDFVLKLNALTGLKFALPTEAQWEYAARGGMTGDVVDYMYAGSNEVDEVACYKDGSEHYTMPVGSKTPNNLNLFDMSGNVMEWCSDKMGNYTQQPQINPTGVLDGSNNVLRGGCWNMPAQNCRVTFRYGSNPMYKVNTFGLRLVLIP